MNNQFDVCFRSIVTPGIFGTLMTINVLSSYASMRMYGEVKMPGYLGFPTSWIATSFIVLDTVPSANKIFEASEILLRNTTPAAARSKSLTNKFLLSCKPLTGESNSPSNQDPLYRTQPFPPFALERVIPVSCSFFLFLQFFLSEFALEKNALAPKLIEKSRSFPEKLYGNCWSIY